MAANILSAPSSDDRRNISSLLNPKDNMDNPGNAGPSSPQVQIDSCTQQPQQMPQGQQNTGVPPIMHTGITHQSHLYPPLPPDHPIQILVQSAAEPNSFRLTRASWGGNGPPPEGFESQIQKRKSPDGTEGQYPHIFYASRPDSKVHVLEPEKRYLRHKGASTGMYLLLP